MNILASIFANKRNSNNNNLNLDQEKIKSIVRIPSNINTNKSLNDIRFTAIDLETTGFKPHMGDKVISLGAVIIDNGEVNENNTFYQLINPNRNIPKIITKLTGINEQMIIDKPSLIEILPDFFSWVGDSILVGHIINFDISFLNSCLSNQCSEKIKYQNIDTREIIISLYPHFTNCSLEEICDSIGISTNNRHNALGDSIMAAKILEFSIKELAKRGVYTLEDLFNFTRDPQFIVSPLLQTSR